MFLLRDEHLIGRSLLDAVAHELAWDDTLDCGVRQVGDDSVLVVVVRLAA